MISSKTFSLISAPIVFLGAAIVWFFVLAQVISFFIGLILLGFFAFLVFWQGLLISRRNGELFGLKTKKQILAISLGASLGFVELIWIISLLPFSFYVLGGLFAAIFVVVFDIFREVFKGQEFKKILKRDIVSGTVFVTILILISHWLPKH